MFFFSITFLICKVYYVDFNLYTLFYVEPYQNNQLLCVYRVFHLKCYPRYFFSLAIVLNCFFHV